jgi:hypothetical protein
MGGMTSQERYQLMIQKMDASFANLSSIDAPRNINTISTNYAGSPPYQLNCGNGAATHVIPAAIRSSYKSIHPAIHHIKIRHKVVTFSRTGIKPVNKTIILPKKAILSAKHKVHSVSVLPAKSKNFHKIQTHIKPASKIKGINHR